MRIITSQSKVNDSDNVIILSEENGYLRHNLPLGGNLVSVFDLDSEQQGEQAAPISEIYGTDVYLYGGNDRLDASAIVSGSISLYIDGGQGNDRLIGSKFSDELYGRTGDDTLVGNAGSDELYGEAGDDHLDGGDSADSLDGGAGSDHLDGGAGDDGIEFDFDD